ncbi:hypothetical protein V6N13_105346 [Hibiscus sabdariffa]
MRSFLRQDLDKKRITKMANVIQFQSHKPAPGNINQVPDISGSIRPYRLQQVCESHWPFFFYAPCIPVAMVLLCPFHLLSCFWLFNPLVRVPSRFRTDSIRRFKNRILRCGEVRDEWW